LLDSLLQEKEIKNNIQVVAQNKVRLVLC